jgi:hypothetical protein
MYDKQQVIPTSSAQSGLERLISSSQHFPRKIPAFKMRARDYFENTSTFSSALAIRTLGSVQMTSSMMKAELEVGMLTTPQG